MAPFNILLVSRHTLFAEALTALLNNTPLGRGARVVGVSQSERATLRLLSELQPDIVLIESSGGLTGRQAYSVKRAFPHIQVAVLNTFGSKPEICKADCADAYLSNITSAAMLLRAIEDIMLARRKRCGPSSIEVNDLDDGAGVTTAEVQSSGLTAVFHTAGKAGALNWSLELATKLSAREILILGYMVQGRKNHEIAALLSRSVRTIENQRFSLRQKLGNPSPEQLIHIATSLQLIS